MSVLCNANVWFQTYVCMYVPIYELSFDLVVSFLFSFLHEKIAIVWHEFLTLNYFLNQSSSTRVKAELIFRNRNLACCFVYLLLSNLNFIEIIYFCTNIVGIYIAVILVLLY